MKIPSPLTPRTDPSRQGLGYLDASASPNAFGAQIGKGLQDVGQGLETFGNKIMVEEKQRNEKIEDFDLARRLSIHNQEFADEVDAIKKNAPPSGEGTRAAINEAYDKRFFGFLSSVPDRAKAEYSYKVQGLRNSWDTQGNSFERTASTQFFKTGIEDETSKSKIAVNQSPELFEAERARLFETIDKTGLSEIEKADLKRNAEKGLQQVHYKREAANGTFTAMNTPIEGAAAVFVNRILNIESGGNPNAKNPKSTATGLGQFLESTWVEQLRQVRPDLTQGKLDPELYALRLDPEISRQVTTHYAIENALKLRNANIAPTPANIYLAHFLGPEGAKRVLTARDNQPIETAVSSDAYKANQAVFKNAPTVGDLKNWAREKMGDAALPAVTATRDASGFWTVPGVEYDLSGKQRPLPPSKEYIEKVVPAVQAVDPGLTVRITSGGQEPGKGTGSHRHDVDSRGESGTTDLVLMKNGKAIRPEEDKALYAKVIENLAAQGFTGIGHYGWGLHVGGGTRAKWGPDKSSATLDPVFSAAIDRGWAKAADGNRDALDTDPRYSTLTYEDRVALRADGQREAQAQATMQYQQQEGVRKQSQNQLYTDLFDGKAGQADIDNARQQGILSSYEDIHKATEILRKKSEDGALEQAAWQKLNTPGAVWGPQDTDDKKMLNAVIGEKGKNAIGAMDKDYFAHTVVPIVERSRDIPTDVVGTLTGMIRSRDQNQVLYSLDALGQLQRTSIKAYEDRVDSKTQADVTRYQMLRNVMPADQLMQTFTGGNTAEERQARAIRRKDGESLLATKDGKVPKIDALVKEVVGQYGGILGFGTPGVQQNASAAVGLERFAQELWLTEYVLHGDEATATKVVQEQVKTRYGVTELGGKGKTLMELPPDKAGYKPLGGNFNWIDGQVREMAKLQPGDKYELQTDEQTRQEFAAFQRDPINNKAPSYGVIKTDANGVPHAGIFENGRPKRVRFEPKAADLQKEIDDYKIKEDLISNRAFFNDFERMKLLTPGGATPAGKNPGFIPRDMPADLVEEYNKRMARQKEIDAHNQKEAIDKFAAQAPRYGDPRAFEIPLIESDTNGDITRRVP